MGTEGENVYLVMAEYLNNEYYYIQIGYLKALSCSQ